MINTRIPIIFFLTFLLAACSGGGSGSGSSGGSNKSSGSAQVEESLERLSDEDYNALSEEDKFGVSNKVMGALFKGIAPDEFFTLGADVAALDLQNDENYVSKIEKDLNRSVNENQYRKLVAEKYEFDEKQRPIQYQLALLYEMPLSKNFFEYWMAYQLTNTILFSPAVELDTVAYEDARLVFERLLSMIRQGESIRRIVYAHMISQENWRRFRSPEDNTREMMEIFLKRFNDAEVPLAAMACKNWSLEEEEDEYLLVVGDDINTEPVQILETTVVTCDEFYQAVAEHAALIPTVTSTLVDIFFYGYLPEDKAQIVDDIVEDDPVTFDDIFHNIIFSKEFLLNAERPRPFEEIFLSLADRTDWYAGESFFKYINRVRSSTNFPSLNNMNQAAMTYKLGRRAEVPLDTLSFAFFHQAVREKLLVDRKSNPDNNRDGGWQQSFIDVDLLQDDFINYLFLSILSRNPSQNELDALNEVIADQGFNRIDRKMQQTMIVLDYISRLSELYHTRPFEKEVL